MKHVEIWGYGLIDVIGCHAIDRVEYDLPDDGARVFIGTSAVHHIAIEPDGSVSIALNCPIETVEIEETSVGLWLGQKPTNPLVTPVNLGTPDEISRLDEIIRRALVDLANSGILNSLRGIEMTPVQAQALTDNTDNTDGLPAVFTASRHTIYGVPVAVNSTLPPGQTKFVYNDGSVWSTDMRSWSYEQGKVVS